MKHLHQTLLCLSLLTAAGLPLAARAQPSVDQCPPLQPAAGLQWEIQPRAQFLLCRAVDAAGTAVFNLMYTSEEPNIVLSRAMRAEKARFGSGEIQWYRVDVAGDSSPDIPFRRITKVKLERGLYAQLWINAASEQQLAQLIGVINDLQPASAQLAGVR